MRQEARLFDGMFGVVVLICNVTKVVQRGRCVISGLLESEFKCIGLINFFAIKQTPRNKYPAYDTHNSKTSGWLGIMGYIRIEMCQQACYMSYYVHSRILWVIHAYEAS